MLGEPELGRIAAALQSRPSPLRLRLHLHESAEATELGATWEKIAAAIAAAAGPGAILTRGDGAGLPATPALSVTGEGRGEIHYLALPLGHQAQPFIEALTAEGPRQMPAELASALRELVGRVELYLFTAAECPHCPRAVSAACELALTSERVSVFVIDAQRFGELASKFKVLSVPSTVIDGGLCITGVRPVAELAQAVLELGTPGHRQRHLLSLLESRRLPEAIELVLGPEGPDALLELWKQSGTGGRVGLLLAAEEALDRAPRSLDAIVVALAGQLLSPDAAMRGDSADLLGKIGHADARPALQALVGDPNADVAEIAADALEQLG